MADIAGGDAYGRRSWIPDPKSDDPMWVDRHKERGSKTNGGAISAGRTGWAMARNKSQNAGGRGGCKLSDAAEDENKLANTVALLLSMVVVVVLSELPVTAPLPSASPSSGGGFFGNSTTEMEENKKV